MPELPEVEIVRLFLDKHVISKTILDLEILTPKSFISSGNYHQLVIGQKIISTSRLGKQLSLSLQNGLVLLFHLKMTGQVVYFPFSQKGVFQKRNVLGHPTKDSFKNLPNKSTRLIFTFSDHSKLFFNDQRKFGWVRLFTQNNLVEFQKNIGFDILSPEFTFKYFYSQLKQSSRAIKTILLDQSKFAGIGNIYANDALFLSHLHPQTPANKITSFKAKNLYQNIINIIKESLSHGGSTAKDNKYIHPDGSFGQHQYHFRVYQKENQACLVCQTPIKRIIVGSRGTFYCPKCQPLLVK